MYIILKKAKAEKIASNEGECIDYHILTDSAKQEIYIQITKNDGDGKFSDERVPFNSIEECIGAISENKPISSQPFKKVFKKQPKNNNNAGFLAAILRAEKLLAPSDDPVLKHLVQPGWSKWKHDMLSKSDNAESY